MRISKEQRRKNIESVYQAVIQLSENKGFDALTMKAIAKEAGIGEATIYNYFPKKENLISGYLDWSFKLAIEKTKSEPLEEMNFSETFHTLLENHIEILSSGKGFFSESIQSLFVSPISLAHTAVGETKIAHKEFLGAQLEQAIFKGDFPEPPFKDFLVSLMWDYHIGMLYYWLQDNDESSMRTTELIDLSLQVLEEILRSNLFNKIYGVAHFLFKEHVLNKMLNPLGARFEKK